MLITEQWLRDNNWTGLDVDIRTSLEEYGFAWKRLEEEAFFTDRKGNTSQVRYQFLYGVNVKNNAYIEFGIGEMSKYEFLDIIQNGWIDIQNVLHFVGCDLDKFIRQFPFSVHDLIQYHGYANIFGDSSFPFTLEYE